MSTEDVPGMNPLNRDSLHSGCWAEHKDGSMVYVLGTEGNKVLYSMFDVSDANDPVEYRDAMPLRQFETDFSYDPRNPRSVRWTWHDKSEFPWGRIMRKFKSGVKPVSADKVIKDAAKITKSRIRNTGTKSGRVSGKVAHKSGVPRQKQHPVTELTVVEVTEVENFLAPTYSKRKGLSNLVEDSPRNEHLEREEPAETVAKQVARSRSLTPSKIEHDDVAHRVEKELPAGGIADRIRGRIQSAINKLIPGRGDRDG